MKRKILIFVVLTVIFSVFAGCSGSPSFHTIPTEEQPTEQLPSDAHPTSTPTELVDPIIAEMQLLLEYNGINGNYYNLALASEYATAADVDLGDLFYYGFKGESKQPTNDELDYLDDWMGLPWASSSGLELIRLPVNKMDEVLSDLFGITLEQTSYTGLDDLAYLEETECYYSLKNSTPSVSVWVRSVERQEGGALCVYYYRGQLRDNMVVTLMPDGSEYRIISNQYVDPMLGEMQSLLEWPGENRFYNYALMSEYADPADVDLYQLFQNGFQDESDDPTELELELLEGKLGEHWKEMDLARLPVKKMDAVLTELFGITLAETNKVGLDKLVYLEETDCYYTANTGVYYADVTAIYTETDYDGVVMVQYFDSYLGNRMVKLMLVDGEYRILSNAVIENLYNENGICNVIDDYFQQREAYLLETSTEISNINPGILPDEASHLAAIHSAGIEWLESEVDVEVKGYWDSHAEATVTEEISFRLDGIVYKESVLHMLQLGLTDDGAILVVSDGYTEKASGFTSCSYVPPDLAE